MTTFFLIRQADGAPLHEQAEAEELWPLSPAGQRQARNLIPLLAPFKLEHLYSSPDQAAIETLQPFAQFYQLKILVLDDLRWHADGRDSRAVATRPGDELATVSPPVETSRSVQRRIVQLIQSLMLHHPEDAVAVALPGRLLTLFLSAIDPRTDLSLGESSQAPVILRLVRGEYGLSWARIDQQRPPLTLVRRGESSLGT